MAEEWQVPIGDAVYHIEIFRYALTYDIEVDGVKIIDFAPMPFLIQVFSFRYKGHDIKLIDFDPFTRKGKTKWGISVDGIFVFDERKIITIKEWHVSFGESVYDLWLEIASGNYKIVVNGDTVKDEAFYGFPWNTVLTFRYDNHYFDITRFATWNDQPHLWGICIDDKPVLDERKLSRSTNHRAEGRENG